MRLYVYVLQARDLPAKDSYVKVQVGRHKSKTWTVKGTQNPAWNEELVFRVHDLDEEVVLSVFHPEGDAANGMFGGSGELMGRARVPLQSVAGEDKQTLPPTWFPLERHKAGKFINKDCGKILVTISLRGKCHDNLTDNHMASSGVHKNEGEEMDPSSKGTGATHKTHDGKHLVKAVANRLEKIFSKNNEGPWTEDSSEVSAATSDYEDCAEESSSDHSFEEAMERMKSHSSGQDLPENLQGGILLDRIFAVPPYDLNAVLFGPDSQFRRDLVNLQGTTDVKEGPWTWKAGEISRLTRVVSYTRAATKLVKAVKATEEQTYLKADGNFFAVLVSVSTPEVPYGNMFDVELLYKIMPGPVQANSGEESSHLLVSWEVQFLQSTMMRGMIEGGVRQGLKESFEQFMDLLAQNFKMMNTSDSLHKDQVLASLEGGHKSDWKSAFQYFCNLTVIFTIAMFFYVISHIVMSKPSEYQGLECYGVDLPDSFGELVTCGILVLQLQRVYYMVLHFVKARLQKGGDHGLKAQGAGWILTVALIEGMNLASLDSTGLPDPYVVLTCNGRMRTSSVKLQTCDPQWNEVLEFDAMEEPPSVLDVEVFDFDGPFDQATSLGHAEINFLKHTATELADMWVFLEGKLAQSSQSKLRLRIFLDNNNGVETIRDYLTKMEKEVGKKLNLRSPHRNSTFQKIFGLPAEEFLISDFTCSLKRKLPLQGRLFLSARIVGFYANFFGHKTRFFFLWEDIEEIQILPASLASVGSPTLVIVLHKGRGLDARHGAKSQDEEGRLCFYFQSFVSFNVASRTIMALWRTRTLTPEQKAQIAEEQQDQENGIISDDLGSILGGEDAQMSKIYGSELPVSISSLMEVFSGGELEHKVMERSGCLNYATTAWETVKLGVFERSVSYKFNRHVSIFGGEVTCTQQKTSNEDGWTVNEVMALHNVPFGDHFRVHFRYQIVKSVLTHSSCKCDAYMGILWLKSIKFQQRISRNVTEKFTHRLREIFGLVEKEIL
ncbi:C2 and GRAM domain-containing protein At5g50170 isoform X1 [Punica granatum]|uniref:C2 and GRAM domain-containing protein At5g50170 isoform X1 n=1 Tax=Punica granatum TaxID=22663 RepID=A0A6P8EES1_PUNGR|nr:C2 and GRAM domain-containing protein At5g50170 isoform X1 [Punica granatum]